VLGSCTLIKFLTVPGFRFFLLFCSAPCPVYLSIYSFSAIPYGPDTDWNYWFGTVVKGAKTGKGNIFPILTVCFLCYLHIFLIEPVYSPYPAGYRFPSSVGKFSFILQVHFPYSAGTFSLFCWYIYFILQVNFPYFVGTFPYTADMFTLFCQYISLILPVHFLILPEHFLFCWCISLMP